MSKKGSRPSVVLASALLLTATSVNAAAPLALTGWDARAVDSARTGALKRLESDECRKVFADFMDAGLKSTRPPQSRTLPAVSVRSPLTTPNAFPFGRAREFARGPRAGCWSHVSGLLRRDRSPRHA